MLHRWLPFSYGVDAFRKAICGQGSLYTDVKVLAVYAMVCGVCSLVVFELRTVKIRQGKKCFTEKLKIG